MLCVPYYALACLQPHAVLLYWLTHASSQYVLFAALNQAGIARGLGVPDVLLPPYGREALPAAQGGGGVWTGGACCTRWGEKGVKGGEGLGGEGEEVAGRPNRYTDRAGQAAPGLILAAPGPGLILTFHRTIKEAVLNA